MYSTIKLVLTYGILAYLVKQLLVNNTSEGQQMTTHMYNNYRETKQLAKLYAVNGMYDTSKAQFSYSRTYLRCVE